MLIRVTWEDIAKGQPYSPTCCPIALAVLRAIDKKVLRLGVNGRSVRCIFDLSSVAMVSELPEEAKEFIKAFDRNRPVRPFFFELELSPKEV